MPGAAPWRYRLHGLTLQSDFELEEPPIEDDGRPPDFTVIDAGDRELAPMAAEPIAHLDLPDFGFSLTPAGDRRWVARYRTIGDFAIDLERRTITANPIGPEGRVLVPLILVGSVMANTLALNGHMTLHASAVEVDGEAIAMAGGSGSGKSTLATLLCGAGAHLVSDDVLRIEVTGRATCFRGSSILRLRKGARSLASAVPAARVFATADGRLGVEPERTAADSLPLAAVLIPEGAPGNAALAVDQLQGAERAMELIRYPRLTNWSDSAPIGAHFRFAADLATVVPVYRVTLPWRQSTFPGIAGEILAELRSTA